MSKELERYFDRLWPLCRSLTGEGIRRSFDILNELMPMERLRFKTGARVFDWTVPKEWVVRDAYIVGPDGKRRCEFKKNNLHLVSYSTPFQGSLPLSELKRHLHSRPDLPAAIPYLTSYYKETWGFCIADRELRRLPKGSYKVVVDTALKPGTLEVAEAVLPGRSKEEVLFSSYLCHPSLANNELSGPLALAFLYKRVAALPKRRYTYRFVLGPETIGPICYLTRRGRELKRRVVAGYVLTCVAGPGKAMYKRSRREGTLADRAAEAVLRERGEFHAMAFNPADGSDDRQWCSPGFDLPMGSLFRGKYGVYPEYHTSLDDKSFISFRALQDSIDSYWDIVRTIEANRHWKNTVMYGEPQLGRRGLYSLLGGQKEISRDLVPMLWLLNLADGTRDLLSVAERSGQPIGALRDWAEQLVKVGLLK